MQFERPPFLTLITIDHSFQGEGCGAVKEIWVKLCCRGFQTLTQSCLRQKFFILLLCLSQEN